MLHDKINSYLDTDIPLIQQRIRKLPIVNLSYFSPINFALFSIRLFRMLVEDIHILHLYQIHEKSCLCVIYGKGTLLFMKLCKAF